MELKGYLAILLRRWIFVVLVPALVLVAVIFQAIQSQPTYTATSRLSVIRMPQPEPHDEYRYDAYYVYLSSEFAVDDLVELTRGNVFAEDVVRTAEIVYGVRISPEEVQDAIESERRHRILTLNVHSLDPERAVLIAQAATDTLERRGTAYFGIDAEGDASVLAIQRPLDASAEGSREFVLYALQLVVALFAGVALAYLVDYLDDSLRSERSVSNALGLPVVATIPSTRSRS